LPRPDVDLRACRPREAAAELAHRSPFERPEFPPVVDRHLDAPRLPGATAGARSDPQAAPRPAASGPGPACAALHPRLVQPAARTEPAADLSRPSHPPLCKRPGADGPGHLASVAAPERLSGARRLGARAGHSCLAPRLVPVHPRL